MKNTGPSLKVRQLVIDRNHHMCLRCNTNPGQVVHHRRPRKRGGTKRPEINHPENLVWICDSCHRDIEYWRADAYKYGWLVKEGIEEPAEIPLKDFDGRHFWLLEDGGITYADTTVPRLHL
jgi:uncharacterized protein with PIN domain